MTLIPKVNSLFFENSYLELVLASYVQFTVGYVYYMKCYKEIFKWHRIGMGTLIILSITIGYLYSIYILIANVIFINYVYNDLLFTTGVSIIVIINLNDYLSDGIRSRLACRTDIISKIQSSTTCLLTDAGDRKLISIKLVNIGDLLIVKRGETVSLDGICVNWNLALIDESFLTGKTQSIVKRLNDNVFAETRNLGKEIIVKVNKRYDKTVLALIVTKIDDIQVKFPRLQRIADRIAAYFTPIVLILAIIAFIINLFFGYSINQAIHILPWPGEDAIWSNRVQWALYINVGILSAARPCAMGIAAPLTVLIGTSKAFKQSIVFVKVEAFDRINRIKIIVLDKTGTLTTGKMIVKCILGNAGWLGVIKTMESFSSHLLSNSFMTWDVANDKMKLLKKIVESVKEEYGYDLTGSVDGLPVKLISYHQALRKGAHISNILEKQLKSKLDLVSLEIFVVLVVENEIVTLMVFTDVIRQNAKLSIELFYKMSIKLAIVSGDNEHNVVHLLGKKLMIDKTYSQVNPIDKANIVKAMQTNHQQIAYVGDGINNLVAFEQADLSIALNSGYEGIKKMAENVLMNSDIYGIYKAIIVTKSIRKMFYFNFFEFFVQYDGIAFNFFDIILSFLSAILMGLGEISLFTNLFFYYVKRYHFKKS